MRRPRWPGWNPVALVAVAFLALLSPALADYANGYLKSSGECRPVRVIDGDTLEIACRAHPATRLRMIGYDTPETGGAQCTSEWVRGHMAKWYLRWRLLSAGDIRIQLTGADRYGRALGRLTVDGQGAAVFMVRRGLARSYTGGRRTQWCGPMQQFRS
ncbi:MAG: thermonuclease family protein [Pseudomonadota bacterium]